jgi:hypothetical protein
MKKQRVLALLLLTSVSILFPIQTFGDGYFDIRNIDGTWWVEWSAKEKERFVQGFLLGQILLGDALIYLNEDDEDLHYQVVEYTLYSFTIAQIIEGIDRFYSERDYRHKLFQVTFAITPENENKLRRVRD